MTDFVSAVAARARVSVEDVATTLARYGVETWTPPTAAQRLSLQKVAFEGSRDGRPIAFEWAVERGVWALTSEDNRVGKTTVLQTIRWLLSGRERLNPTARTMVQTARLDFTIGDEQCAVTVSGPPDGLTGTITVGSADPIAVSDTTFEDAVGRIMITRLGLERVVGWQRFPRSQDGQAVDFRWPSLLPGVFVPPASSSALLGERTEDAGRLFQMFTGLPWYSTVAATNAALSAFRQGERDASRRSARDASANHERSKELEAKLGELKANAKTTLDGPGSAARLAAAANGLEEARAALDRARIHASGTAADLALARDTLTSIRRRERDLQETGAAAGLFGTLQPKRCPRCETAIDEHRQEQEAADHVCAVCARPHDDPGDEYTARLEELGEQLSEAESAAETARAVARQADQAVVAAQTSHRDASDRYESARREVESMAVDSKAAIDIARLEGMLEEVKRDVKNDSSVSSGVSDGKVLRAAKREAEDLMDARPLLQRLDDALLETVHHLNLHDITGVRLDRAAHLTVQVGKTSTTYSALSPGEQYRIKVALVVALMRIGRPSRHPGLLVIDSPAAEEMSDANLDRMLTEIVTLADAQENLQVLIATQRSDAIAGVLPSNRIRHVPRDKRLW